jgi:hypothetical protein
VTPLLKKIADIYLREHETELGNMAFVFPNRRAGLFFLNYIAQSIERPLFAPQTLTINELFGRLSPLQSADRISMLFSVYSIYKTLSNKDETFDKFAYWGEMLLNDFDDVDKYMADARQLFTNVTELKQIDSFFDYLSPNQIEAIRRFWSTFVPAAESAKQKDFRATWEILYPLYEQFRNELLSKNEAYEGMIFREVAERMQRREAIETGFSRLIFIGFNALTPTEEALFTYFRNARMADFYWDYDIDELKDTTNRGGDFRRHNMETFKSRYALSDDEPRDRSIELIAVPSGVGQTKLVRQKLQELYPEGSSPTSEELMKTVVILSDENLLLPMLHSVPRETDKVNITMGYPLSITPAAALVDHLFALQRTVRRSGETQSFYYRNVQLILQHPYLLQAAHNTAKELSENITRFNKIYISKEEFGKDDLLKLIFTHQPQPRHISVYICNILKKLMDLLQQPQENETTAALELEFVYHCYTAVNRIGGLLENFPVEMSNETFARLVRQLIAGISIPFEGEPLAGLQIMGLLETRALDFENVIITSLNEGVFPQKQSAPSFIPYNLRKGFGLPTGEHQDAIFAYHFYRLIHRAQRVICTYDTRSEGLQSGEVSRYIYQLKYHYRQPVAEKTALFDIGFAKPETVVIPKTAPIIEKLTRYLTPDSGKALSASAINTYIDCPLKFYLGNVVGLRERDDVEETIAANTFGSIFHTAIEVLYKPFCGRMVPADAIETLLKHPTAIPDAVALAFTKEFLKKEGIVRPEGQYLLTTGVIEKYIARLLQFDKEHAPFEYVASEFPFNEKIPLFNATKTVNLKGYIDRIDTKNGTTRILDYKTGGKDQPLFRQIEQLFDKNAKKRPKAVFQTFMYSMLYQQKTGATQIEPGIVAVRSLFKDDFSAQIFCKPDRNRDAVTDFSVYRNDFGNALTCCLEEMFDPRVPFTQTSNPDICKYCPFTIVCKR